MIANSLVGATAILAAIVFGLAGELKFLVPYKPLLIHRYAGAIAIYAGLLFLNLFAAFFLLTRKLFLKDSGRKLAHMEKQLRSGSINEELSARLR